MKQPRLSFCALAFMLYGATPAMAQDSGAVGVTMGYPSSVGVMWHVTERFALRPEVSFSTSTNETPLLFGLSSITGPSTSSSSVSTSTSSTIGVGISGLFYVGKWDALRAYVAPRFVYTRSSGTSEYTSEPFVVNPSFGTAYGPLTPVTVTTKTESTLTSKSGMGLFGASYSLHERFTVFGEVGFGYSTSGSKSTSTPEPDLDILVSGGGSHGWSTRTGAGVIFYF
jgi:hypothetical protein